jgi:hypothetical protein
MNFPHAMEALIAGRKIRRESWGENFFVFRKDNQFFVDYPARGKFIPFFPMHDDVLAIDWVEVVE